MTNKTMGLRESLKEKKRILLWRRSRKQITVREPKKEQQPEKESDVSD